MLASIVGCTLLVLRKNLSGKITWKEIFWLYLCALCVGYFNEGVLIWLGKRSPEYIDTIDYIGYISLATGFVSEKIVLFFEKKLPEIMTSLVSNIFNLKNDDNK